MSRLVALVAATWFALFVATPAAAQSQSFPAAGGGGASCTVATPCTVTQKIAPALTTSQGLIIDGPSGASVDQLIIRSNGTDKFNVSAGGTLVQRGGTQQFGNHDINYGQSFGWSDGSTNRAKIFGGDSTCLGQLILQINGNGGVNSVMFGPFSVDGPFIQGRCSTATPTTRGFSGDQANGTNIAGGKVQFMGGSSTGNAAGGSATLATTPKGSSGATANTTWRDVVIADTNAHVSFGGSIPTVGGTCGTSPAITTGSTDTAGEITAGSGSPSSCTITFATAYAAAPFCVVTAQTSANMSAYLVSTTAITLSISVAGTKANYVCHGA